MTADSKFQKERTRNAD